MSTTFPTTMTIDQARDWYLTVTYQDSTGTAINLTGYTATFTMTSGATTLTLTSGSGITITPATGVIAIHATASQTSIDAGQYRAELIITSGSGIITSLLKGQLSITPKVA